jgi:hypothetical protein
LSLQEVLAMDNLGVNIIISHGTPKKHDALEMVKLSTNKTSEMSILPEGK